MARSVSVCDDSTDVAERSAACIVDAAAQAAAARGVFTICLSGGDTPASTYSRLAQIGGSLPWDRTHVFWGDERCIPLDRPDNHFTMATDLMLSLVPIPPENVHRVRGEAADAAAAAAEYETMLREFFATDAAEVPVFDLLLLGMGEDGHVASIFPGSDGAGERKRWVVDHYATKRGERVRRLTLTMPVLTAARQVMILVSGELKAEMLAAVLGGEADVPAREIDAEAANAHWIVDREAASVWERHAVAAGGGSR